MAKKKPKGPNKIPTDKYWELRATIAELQTAKAEKKAIDQAAEILKLRAELAHFALRNYRLDQIPKGKSLQENADAEYHRFIGQLEKQLGFSIKGKIIDPVTYEVVLDDDTI